MKKVVTPAIDEITFYLSTKLINENSKNALKLNKEVNSEKLKMLQNKLAVVPIDKANGNIEFVAHRYYARVLIIEPGLSNVSKTVSIYMKAIKPADKFQAKWYKIYWNK